MRLLAVLSIHTAVASASVLPPWTPLEHGPTGTIHCWNRTYDVSNGPLPKIMSAGKQLFVERPSIRVLIEGKEYKIQGRNRLVESGTEIARQQGSMPLPGGGQTHWETELHYDGWFQVTFRLDPKNGPFSIDGMRLILPLFAEHATELGTPQWTAWNGRDWSCRLGSETAAGRRQPPCFWLGDRKRGVAWMGSSDANWTSNTNNNVYVKKKENYVVLEIRMCHQTVRVKKELEYVFAVQATPVRPSTARSRDFMIGLAGERNVYGQRLWWETGRSVTALAEDPDFTTWQTHRRWYPRGLIPYHALYGISRDSTVYDSRWSRWRNGEPVVFPNPRAGSICIGARPWRKWILQRAEEALRHEEVAGIYLDVANVFKCNNPNHGCQLVDDLDRKIPAHWNVWKQREIHRKLYALCESHGKSFLVHAHSAWFPGIHGWAHYLVPGEDLYWTVNRDRDSTTSDNPWAYVDSVNLRYWQTLDRLGPGILFLPQFGRASPENKLTTPQPSRSVLGLVAVHGVGLWSAFANTEECKTLYQNALKPWADADFFSYWDGNEYSSEPLLASYFQRTNGERLVVYFNPTDRPLRINGRTRVPPRDYLLVKQRKRSR